MKSKYRIMDCSDILAKDPFCYVDGSPIQMGDYMYVVDDKAEIAHCTGFGIGSAGPYIDLDGVVMSLSRIEEDGILFCRQVLDRYGVPVEEGDIVEHMGDEYEVLEVDPLTQTVRAERRSQMRIDARDVQCV